MGHVKSKTRSLGQICHILSLIVMKLSQNVCLDEISEEFENGSYWVKNQVTKSNLGKTLYTLQRSHFLSDYHEACSECLS